MICEVFETTTMVFLLDLPNELLWEIVKYLDQQKDINSIARLSQDYHSFFNDDIYRFNISSQRGRGVLWAIAHDRASAVAKFLDLGFNIDPVTSCDRHSALLHLACRHGSLSTIELLLKGGADINAQNKRGITPLFHALKYGHLEVVRTISKEITDIGNIFVDHSKALTPLHAACIYKMPQAARIFLELGDDARAKDADGKSPLHHTLSGDEMGFLYVRGHNDAVFDTIMVLLEYGVKLDLVEFEYPRTEPVSTFELGVHHKSPRVRGLFRGSREETLITKRDQLCIGRSWMFSDAGKKEISSNGHDRYRHNADAFSETRFNSYSKNCSEIFTSGRSEADEPETEPGFIKREENSTIVIDNHFPALADASPARGINTQTTADIWSPSKVQQMVTRSLLTEEKVKIHPTHNARQTEAFPHLNPEKPLKFRSSEARDMWSNFRKPLAGDRVEELHDVCAISKSQTREEKCHISRSKRRWQALVF